MAVVINTNVDSIKIQNCLTSATNKMSSIMERMSTGLKVNSAKDDAAGCVIASKMQVQLDGNKIAQNNVQNASALLSTAEGNLNVVEENLVRIRDLTLQAKNGTYSDSEIKAMQDEVAQRIDEINRVSTSSSYSSLQLFGAKEGNADAGLAKDGAVFQVGANAADDNTIKADSKLFKSVEFSSMAKTAGVSFTGAKKFDLTSMKATKAEGDTDTVTFTDAISALDAAINDIADRKSQIGSVGNRLDSALATLQTQYENLSSAKSIITDADIASEASKYTQESILQQVSTSLLAQANQAPGIALSLV